MNIKLVLQLSLFGLAMAVLTIWLPSSIEPFFWLVIFLFCAWVIAKRCTSNYFLNGLLIGICNSAWITAFHIMFYQIYIANHPQEAEMMTSMPMPDSPRIMMLITGPIVGIVSGIVLGLLAVIASKVVKKA